MLLAKVTRKIGIWAIAGGVLTVGMALTAPEAQALQILSSYSLKTNEQLNALPDAQADSDWFGVSFQKDALTNTVRFDIENKIASGNTTKISKVYFGTDGGTPDDDTDGFFKYFQKNTASISSQGSTNYSINWSPTGASQINNNAGWGVEVLADNENTKDASIINPGDILSITFNLMNPDITEEELVAAFTTKPQELGIAFHVQSIAGAYSEWYAAQPVFNPGVVPTPGAILPVLGGILGAALKRRKREESEDPTEFDT